jgi:hypothetical protein
MKGVMHMNIKLNTLASVIAMATLAGCGGSGDNNSAQSPETAQANFANDPTSAQSSGSVSLAGTPLATAANDLAISNVAITGTFDSSGTAGYRFTLTNGGSNIPVDLLSVALEVSATGDFNDAFRTALFDIRAVDGQSSGSEFTARSAPVNLPGGSYSARLVVNPNWQYAFDTVPAGHNHATPYRYIAESDFSNNASNVFQISVAGSISCTEDGFEHNDTLATAHELPVGGQIDSSLCHDNVDIYSVALGSGESASLSFDYTDTETNNNPATRYVVIDPSMQTHTAPGVARETSNIVIDADTAGTYYLALYGQRSSYRLSRNSATGSGIANDFVDTNVFSAGTLNGPQSWLLGNITLQKLNFTAEKITDQVINCGRITTQFSGDAPVAYVTPDHFADIHEFRFLPGGDYLIDAEQETGWTVSNGDIANPDWYTNDYPGYAQRLSNNEWRYWSTDGLAYVECQLEVN